MIFPTRSDTELHGGAGTATAQATSAETDQRVLAVFDQFLRAHDDDVTWVACGPLWAEYRVNAGADGGGGRPAPSTTFSAPRRAARIVKGLAGHFRDRYLICGDAIFVASTKSQERVVAPLLDTPAGATRAIRKPLHAPVGPLVRLVAAARERAEELRDALRRAEVEFPGGSLPVYELFFAAALHLAYSRQLIEKGSPSVVVVGSNHNVAARALARAADEKGVPSVFLPHAPMLGDLRLRDAPTDYVAVRGEREAAWYLAKGAEPDQVVAVGDPGLQPAPQLVAIPTGAPVVFAPSPYADEVVASQVALVAAATDGEVLVTPHPRQRLDFLQEIAPSNWVFHRGSTYERLREGATAVVQSSSGVALESLLLGIPVLEIEPVGGRLYPFLESDLVPAVRTPEELVGKLEAIRARIADPDYREGLAEYARGWCSEAGDAAAQNMVRLVQLAAADGKRSRLVHDAWRPSDGQGV
jgi:hypothetical protein